MTISLLHPRLGELVVCELDRSPAPPQVPAGEKNEVCKLAAAGKYESLDYRFPAPPELAPSDDAPNGEFDRTVARASLFEPGQDYLVAQGRFEVVPSHCNGCPYGGTALWPVKTTPDPSEVIHYGGCFHRSEVVRIGNSYFVLVTEMGSSVPTGLFELPRDGKAAPAGKGLCDFTPQFTFTSRSVE